jgi:SAM-dependent methyltransferase
MTTTEAFTDRRSLATQAYADPTNLTARYAIYQHQRPAYDLPAVVTELLSDLDGPVLDVGCGPGRFTNALRADRSERRVVAVDLSPGMVAAAGGLAVADAAALPMRSDVFGVVMALHMLYHVADPAIALAEFARVKRDNGTVLLSTNADGDKREMRQLHADAAAAAGVSVPDNGLAMRFNLEAAEVAARGQFASVRRIDLESEVEVATAEPVVAFIESSRAWYEGTDNVTAQVRRLVEAAIADQGAFRFRTHMGFLMCQ